MKNKIIILILCVLGTYVLSGVVTIEKPDKFFSATEKVGKIFKVVAVDVYAIDVSPGYCLHDGIYCNLLGETDIILSPASYAVVPPDTPVEHCTAYVNNYKSVVINRNTQKIGIRHNQQCIS